MAGGGDGSKKPIHPNDDVNMSHHRMTRFPRRCTLPRGARAQRVDPGGAGSSQLDCSESKTVLRMWLKSGDAFAGRSALTIGQEMGGWASLLARDVHD